MNLDKLFNNKTVKEANNFQRKCNFLKYHWAEFGKFLLKLDLSTVWKNMYQFTWNLLLIIWTESFIFFFNFLLFEQQQQKHHDLLDTFKNCKQTKTLRIQKEYQQYGYFFPPNYFSPFKVWVIFLPHSKS